MQTEPQTSRRGLIAIVALLMSVTALSVDIVLPAFDEIRAEFGLGDQSAATAGLITAYLIGLAVPQIVYGPLSDRYGRKPILFFGLGLFVVGTAIGAMAQSLDVMLVGRFVAGLGAAAPRVLSLSIIRDTHEGERMARMMSFVMAIFISVPILAPSVGAGLIAAFDWRAVFWFSCLYGIVVAALAMRLPETRPPQFELKLNVRDIGAAMRHVLTNRQTLGYTLAITVIFGVFTSYLATSERIWDTVYGRGDQFPLIFGGIALIFGLNLLTNGLIVDRIGTRRVGHVAIGAYVTASIVIATVSFATDGRPGFWIFLVLLAAQLACQSFLMPNFNTLALAPMARVAGTASAFVGGVTTAGAALVGAIVDNAFNGTVGPLTLAFLAAGIFAIAVVSITERGKLTWSAREVPTELRKAPPPVD